MNNIRSRKISNWHRFEMDGVKLLFDVRSGSIHRLDPVAWDVLELYGEEDSSCIKDKLSGRYSPEHIDETISEIGELIESGLLASPDEMETPQSFPSVSHVKALCLHVSHDCNLRCRYCFASSGHFGGKRLLMSEETAFAAIDFLMANSGPRKHCEIDFFGGEPLMNFDVVKKTVDYAKAQAERFGKILKLTLTTNVTLLTDAVADYLKEQGISLILSLDGRRSVNDFMRPFPNGQGSYDVIISRIKRFFSGERPQACYIRGTYTAHNLDFSDDVKHIVDSGLTEISMEPVVASPEEDYALRSEHIPILSEEYEKLARFYLERHEQGKPFTFFHFNMDILKGPCLAKRLSGCGAGFEYLAVTPEGNLYPCHQFVGRDEYLIGDIRSGITNEALVQEFGKANIYTKDGCRDCWARFLCSGGCHANAHFANGSILKPHDIGCILARKRIECAIYVQSQILYTSQKTNNIE